MKIESGFLCDDVRRETNGKFIFIGTYNQEIILSQFPANLRLHFVMCANFFEVGTKSINVEISLDKAQIATGDMQVTIEAEGFGLLPVPLPLSIPNPGELKIRARLQGGKWQDVRVADIKAPPSGKAVTSDAS